MSFVRKFALRATLTAAAVLAACTDGPGSTGPTSPSRSGPGASANAMGTCTTMENLEALAAQVFGAGSPNVNSVLGKLDNLRKKVEAGDIVGAQEQANNIVRFVRDKAAEGRLPGTTDQINQFIAGVLCYAGLSPDTFLIQPSDSQQVLIASEGASGVSLEPNTVTEPTLLTLTPIDSGPSPLITELDQYPSYVSITVSSALTKPAVVAVCPVGLIETSIRARLRLGHQTATGFEITPPASGAFLPCAETAPASSLPAWVKKIASLFTPRPLYAAMEAGGVGGSVTEFSPFGAVDTELGFAGGGVGGSTTEFIRTLPSNPKGGMTLNLVSGDVCTEMSATVGTPLEPECRPLVTIATHNGHVLEGVPVAWTVTAGGGTIAPYDFATQTCGTFGASAATATDSVGKASICWTMGPNGGTNSVTAVPSAGGDAPAGVTFKPSGLIFSATGLKITPTASATGGSFVFDNAAHAGSGTCSNDLTPELTYSSGSAPMSVGEYTLTVTCGSGSTVYNTVTATAAISISAAVPAVAVSCPESVVYDGTAQTPCSASVTAPGLSLTPAPTYSANVDVGTATASVAVAADGNYAAASGSATFLITPAATTTAVSCPASQTYTGEALTPCSASTTGPGGLNTATAVTYADNVNAGTATASAAHAAGGNYLGSTGSATFTIEPAASVTAVSCPASVTFTGAALTPCTASVTGAGGLNASLTPTYSDNVNAGTASASASYDGDANHLGSSASGSFTIAPAATSVAVSCQSSLVYDGTVRNPCSATVTGPALSAPVGVTYSATPFNAGGYTASATYDGGGNWVGSSGAATFSIAKLGATATAGSGTINFGAAVPTLSCSVSGLLAADAGSITCTTSVPTITVAGSYATTPVISPANPVNYSVVLVNGTLNVAAYVQVNCFSSPIYNVMPPTKSAQRKGSNLPVKCGLTTPQGAPVTTAKGNLVVQDRGTNGLATPVTVFAGTNVFKLSTGGNYSYGLDTSPAGFVVGHYYYVTATWNDGSTTTGWFLLK